ncbi:hypothetical protein [Hoeflea sp. TYP-13]|uniref:hypothetical protein n=1 Tax=Hoeflea sp. TYP-13 TaxID=3230023 RepID=UPI0034C6138E
MTSEVSKWLKGFWWTRGVFAAISLVALLPKIVNLSRYEILRAIHAAILAWDVLASKIGEAVGELFLIPPIPSTIVNFVIFMTTIGLPVVFGSYKFAGQLLELYSFIVQKSRHPAFGGADIIARVFINALTNPTIKQILTIVGAVNVCFLMALLYYYAITFRDLDPRFRSGFDFYWNVTVSLLVCSISFYYGVRRVPGFARGLVTVATFLLCLEVLYLLQTPYLTNAINSFACEWAAHPDDKDCKAKIPDQKPASGS